MGSYQATHIDDISAEKWPYWAPIRHHFGITTFGINAWRGGQGDEVIKRHHESESGSPELYLVVGDTGARKWVLRRMEGGRSRELGLGSARDVPLAEARRRAEEARQALARGDVAPEAPLAAAHEEDDLPEARVPIEQHRPEDLADEPRRHHASVRAWLVQVRAAGSDQTA